MDVSMHIWKLVRMLLRAFATLREANRLGADPAWSVLAILSQRHYNVGRHQLVVQRLGQSVLSQDG